MNQETRKSGIDCPWNLYQSFTIAIYLGSVLVLLLQIFPSFTNTLQIITGAFFSLTFSCTFFFYIKLTISDPTDPIVSSFKSSSNLSLKDELKSKSNCFCNSCMSPVTSSRSKHCVRCNRCVFIFDHHCKFVNNCVGRLNYHLFIKLIIWLELLEFVFLYSASVFIWAQYWNLKAAYLTIFLLLVKSFVVAVMNGYLLTFHIFISRRKQTTYEFMMQKIQMKQEITPDNGMM